MIRRVFLATSVLLLACGRDPTPRPIPQGKWWKKGVALTIDPKRIELVRRLETEPAPLIVDGSYESRMQRDGSFVLTMTVTGLKRELKTKKDESGPADILQPLETASFDGEAITKRGSVALTLTFSENDHVVEMCFTSSKKCQRLQQE